ncbi:MAG TPA: serine--tRNA ligase [Vicinamibacteria bacterium]|nr:serine--tRNA ligase [Vicinamibacteria bacterium]
MLDAKLLVDDRARVMERMAARGLDETQVLAVGDPWALDAERRRVLLRVEELRHRQRVCGEEIARRGKAKEDAADLKAQMKGVSDEVKELDARLQETEARLRDVLLQLPNLPAPEVPIGRDAAANREMRRWGEPRRFEFAPRPHWEIGAALGILDFERAAKVSGARFVVSWGLGARLERALIQFMLDLHTRERGYTEVIPPYLVTPATMLATGQLPKFEGDLFKTRAGDRELFLIPTAEVPLTALHGEEILEAGLLPRRYVAFTPCFRSEAGSYGRDVRGIIRQHQFHKVELVKLTTPETSMEELERMVLDAAEVLQRLELPYRVILLSTGDMGFNSAKTYDLEVWLPGQGEYKEISSCSNCTDFQARRGSLRYRPEPKAKPRFLHTLNGSGLAVGRTLVAILENYQQVDGSVVVPQALRPFMDGVERIAVESAG